MKVYQKIASEQSAIAKPVVDMVMMTIVQKNKSTQITNSMIQKALLKIMSA